MSEFRPSRPEEIPALRKLWKEAFADPDTYLDLFFSTAYAPERSIVLAEDDALLGAAYWLECSLSGQSWAYVYAAAIRASHQNQGLGTQLMDALHDRLTSLGYTAALLVPGDPSLWHYYRRFGYRTLSHIQEFTVRAASPVPLTSLTSGEYAALRRRFLPENGLLQEGAGLALLSAISHFYAGEGFLCAVSTEGALCTELLGDPSAAPGIAAALGFDRFRFRGPGTRIPYAMGKPLGRGELPASVYFGFGFD